MAKFPANAECPWLVDMPEDVYHKDPSPTPSLSASIAKLLVNESCYHAFRQHPRLGGLYVDDKTEAKERGALIHALLLGTEERVVVLPYDDYRKADARRARDTAIAMGKVPIKEKDYDGILNIVNEARGQIARHGGDFAGACEAVGLWNYDHRGTAVACRTRFDHVAERDGRIIIDDVKSIADPHPEKIQRAIEEYGYDIQRHAYICAVESLRPEFIGRVTFRHWFVSTSEPLIVVPVELDGQYAELGRVKWESAVDLWVECRKTDRWPTFGDGKTIRLSPPHWVMNKHLGFEAAKSIPHLKG